MVIESGSRKYRASDAPVHQYQNAALEVVTLPGERNGGGGRTTYRGGQDSLDHFTGEGRLFRTLDGESWSRSTSFGDGRSLKISDQ